MLERIYDKIERENQEFKKQIQDLYDHRNNLFIALCKTIYDGSTMLDPIRSYRSKKHSDGSKIEKGWFILGLWINKNQNITYHLPIKHWKECSFCVTLPKGEWDGHTSKDVLERLKKI